MSDEYIPDASIEPHSSLLSLPEQGQHIYKEISIENLVKSVTGKYLHFNRVDAYRDFPEADLHDGEQSPLDRLANAKSSFVNNPEFNAERYYDQCRSRTYACCFSLDQLRFNSTYQPNSVCLEFDFYLLRDKLNRMLSASSSALLYGGISCYQIFSINYGLVRYVDWEQFRGNTEYLQNPIQYVYTKDRERFEHEKELRITLHAIGIGRFILNDGSEFDFPDSLQLSFDIIEALRDQTVTKVICFSQVQYEILNKALDQSGVVVNLV